MSVAKQVQIIQGTPQWHEWRRTGVGASDVAALFDQSPYKTLRDLAFEKAGLGEPDDEDKAFIFRRGHQVEAMLRKELSKFTKIELLPACFEKGRLLGSLDGYDKSFGVMESKLVGKDVLKKAKGGEIPEHHRLQIQSQLESSDSDKGVWIGAVWNQKERKIEATQGVEIGRNEPLIKSIVDKVNEFWAMLQDGRFPPLSARDTLFLTDPAHIKLVGALKNLKAQKDEIEREYEIIETEIKALATHTKVKCDGVLIFEAERSGSIEYLKIPEIKALSEDYLEKFRKKSSKYKSIRFGKAE